MPRFIYKKDADGLVRAFPSEIPYKGTPNEVNGSFHERVKRAYYDRECNGGYQGAYPKGMVKQLHENAIARGE